MHRTVAAGFLALAGVSTAWGQGPGPDAATGQEVRSQVWQPVGDRRLNLGLAGSAGAGARTVTFTADGQTLFAVTRRGGVWASTDVGESWSQAPLTADDVVALAAVPDSRATDLPEPLAAIYSDPFNSNYIFALGRHLYRSSDQGRTWMNLTADAAGSIIGDMQQSIAFSPQNPDLIVVGNSRGVWRSLDAGLTWTDLNQNLPNLPEARLLSLDPGSEKAGMRLFLANVGAVQWNEARGWEPTEEGRVAVWRQNQAALPNSDQLRSSPWPLDIPAGWAASYRVFEGGRAVSGDLTACGGRCSDPQSRYISALSSGHDSQPATYAGTSDGQLWLSRDSGRSWSLAMAGLTSAGPINAIFVDPENSRIAVAVAGGRGAGHVFRTTNAGAFWDDITSNLPDAPARSVAVNRETGSIYVASGAGVFYTRAQLSNPAPATTWIRLGGNLPPAAIEDVKLDAVSGLLYAAVAGQGIFRTTVPEIADALRVLHAADLTPRPAAPGGLLTVLGPSIRSAAMGATPAPLLSSAPGASQIQVPFEARGNRLDLTLETPQGSTRVGMPLEAVSPGIFVDRDGSPLILDAGGGELIGATRPAKAGAQVLVLATGLGGVRPEWPTGVPAPLESPPVTIAPISAYLDGASARVLSATLAGGYIGVYAVRVELPSILNSGTAELTLASGDKVSNRVRIFITP